MRLLQHIRIILPLLLTVLTLVGCATPPPLTKLPENAVIVAFGDSLTAGTGGTVGYPQHLARLTGRDVINSGVPGETSVGALRRLPSVLEQYKPNLLIVCIGGNDFLRRLPATETERNLQAIVDIARAANIPVVLIAVPRPLPLPWNHPVYETVADQNQLWLDDDILKQVLHDNRLKSDRIHPNDAGYLLIAESIAALLHKAGAV